MIGLHTLSPIGISDFFLIGFVFQFVIPDVKSLL